MRKSSLLGLAALLLLGAVGCSQEKTPEEIEAAKYPKPKMMSEEEGKKWQSGQAKFDPRQGGTAPRPESNR